MQSSGGNILYVYIYHKNNDPKTVKTVSELFCIFAFLSDYHVVNF